MLPHHKHSSSFRHRISEQQIRRSICLLLIVYILEEIGQQNGMFFVITLLQVKEFLTSAV